MNIANTQDLDKLNLLLLQYQHNNFMNNNNTNSYDNAAIANFLMNQKQSNSNFLNNNFIANNPYNFSNQSPQSHFTSNPLNSISSNINIGNNSNSKTNLPFIPKKENINNIQAANHTSSKIIKVSNQDYVINSPNSSSNNNSLKEITLYKAQNIVRSGDMKSEIAIFDNADNSNKNTFSKNNSVSKNLFETNLHSFYVLIFNF